MLETVARVAHCVKCWCVAVEDLVTQIACAQPFSVQSRRSGKVFRRHPGARCATLDQETAQRLGRDEQELAGKQVLLGHPVCERTAVALDCTVEQIDAGLASNRRQQCVRRVHVDAPGSRWEPRMRGRGLVADERLANRQVQTMASDRERVGDRRVRGQGDDRQGITDGAAQPLLGVFYGRCVAAYLSVDGDGVSASVVPAGVLALVLGFGVGPPDREDIVPLEVCGRIGADANGELGHGLSMTARWDA